MKTNSEGIVNILTPRWVFSTVENSECS